MTNDDFDFLDALDETDALGELLGTPSGATAKAERAPEAEIQRCRQLLRRPARAALRSLSWTRVPESTASRAEAQGATSESAEATTPKADRGDNYLQSISW